MNNVSREGSRDIHHTQQVALLCCVMPYNQWIFNPMLPHCVQLPPQDGTACLQSFGQLPHNFTVMPLCLCLRARSPPRLAWQGETARLHRWTRGACRSLLGDPPAHAFRVQQGTPLASLRWQWNRDSGGETHCPKSRTPAEKL